jgi:hypothetical protein
LQKILLDEGGIFEQGIEIQAKALARIREKFTPPRPAGSKAPWARPAPK